jgi:light-regulated signal transduction histidine kinase (bacteriophytochrome)
LAELETKHRELQRSNSALEEFALAASHDLQEPLRAVRGFLALLERRYKEKLDPEGEEYITLARDGAQRMSQLINGLLEYARVDSRGRAFERVELSRCLSSALADLQAEISSTGSKVTFDELPTVFGEAIQLSQVFRNLVGNAIKFRKEEPACIHVGKRIGADGEEVVYVEDNGIGLDPREVDRVFRMFVRLHPPTKYPGTGVGLALCKRIIERHQGRIWVESRLGEGTTVCFTMPPPPPV